MSEELEDKRIIDFDESATVESNDRFTFWRVNLGKMLQVRWSTLVIFINQLIQQAISAINLALVAEWENTKTYELDELATFGNRLWKSKDNGNLNNEPPSAPEVTENTWWIEQSPAEATKIPNYVTGTVFTETQVTVEDNGTILKLIVPEIELPFTTADLEAEITAGKWRVLGGESGGGGGGDGVPDGTFMSLTANNVTLNPIKEIRNNYLLTRSDHGRITLDFSDVPEGAEGIIEVVNSGVVRKLGFDDFGDWKIGQDVLTELAAISASGKTITGAANNGSGLIRITAAAHGYTTGERVEIAAVVGTVEANGKWIVTVIDVDTFDLDDSAFVSAYTSGGTATLLENFIFLNEETNGTSVFSFYVRGGKLVLNGNALMI